MDFGVHTRAMGRGGPSHCRRQPGCEERRKQAWGWAGRAGKGWEGLRGAGKGWEGLGRAGAAKGWVGSPQAASCQQITPRSPRILYASTPSRLSGRLLFVKLGE